MSDLITFDPQNRYFLPLHLCTFAPLHLCAFDLRPPNLIASWIHSPVRLMKVVIFGDCAQIRSLIASSQTRLQHNADRYFMNLIPVTIQGTVATPGCVVIVTNQGEPHR